MLTGDDHGSGNWMVSVLLFQVDSMAYDLDQKLPVYIALYVLQASRLVLGLISPRLTPEDPLHHLTSNHAWL